MSARQEIQFLEMQKNMEKQKEEEKNLEKDIQLLENKVRSQEESLKKKSEKEYALINELQIYQNRIQQKEDEIETLNGKMVMFETFKHKYYVKQQEAEMLLQRVEELSHLNGDL